MNHLDSIKQTLNANSESTTVDELKARGTNKVKVLRTEQVAAMIAEAVQRAVRQSGALSQQEHEQLVRRGREEFQLVIKQREREVLEARRAASEVDALRAQLQMANQRADELRQLLDHHLAQPQTAAAGGGGDSAALSAMLDQLSGALNQKLDKFGLKLGVSNAVEAGEVRLDGLFGSDFAESLESNMDDVQVREKTASGIGSSLAKLKAMKGG